MGIVACDSVHDGVRVLCAISIMGTAPIPADRNGDSGGLDSSTLLCGRECGGIYLLEIMRAWTDEEREYVRTHVGAMTKEEIAEVLGRSSRSVERAYIESLPHKEKKREVRGLHKDVDLRSKVSQLYVARYLAETYDYTYNVIRPGVLRVRKDGRRSHSEKVLADIYNLTIIETGNENCGRSRNRGTQGADAGTHRRRIRAHRGGNGEV